ncbi:MAG: NifU family protein [Egibacteraceae bacterium]
MDDSEGTMDPEEVDYDDMLSQMASLVEEVDSSTSELRGPVLELLDYLEAWHREGLTRLVTSLPPEALDAAREDPVVAHLLDTYLADDEDGGDASALVEEALEEIRPYVHTHGGEMELVEIDGGVVTLSLMGACDGCPSSMVTLTQGVEQILRDRWPDFRALKVAGEDEPVSEPAPQQLLQIQSLKRD